MAVVLHGIREFDDSVTLNVEKANLAARAIVTRGALEISSAAKRVFKNRPGGQITSKTGRTYYSFKAPYNATPPTPTSRSGKLRASIGSPSGKGVMTIESKGTGWMATFGTAVSYAPYVEYGTKYMAKEPFMRKGLDDSKEKVQMIAEAEWAKVA